MVIEISRGRETCFTVRTVLVFTTLFRMLQIFLFGVKHRNTVTTPHLRMKEVDSERTIYIEEKLVPRPLRKGNSQQSRTNFPKRYIYI